jgi:hypothetical protein
VAGKPRRVGGGVGFTSCVPSVKLMCRLHQFVLQAGVLCPAQPDRLTASKLCVVLGQAVLML